MRAAEKELQTKKLWYLKKIKVFSDLSWQEQKEFDRTTRIVRYRKGERIVLSGDSNEHVSLVQEGQVKISKVSKDGRESTLTILESGEIFGEMDASNPASYESILEAIEPVAVCEIQRKNFDKYIQTYTDIGGKVLTFTGGRIRQLETRVHDLVFKSPSARLAALLVELSETMGKLEDGVIELRIRLTHENLGNLIGISRETVSTLMAQFVQYGLLEQERRYIRILDIVRLATVH
ncbi:Crp/Fnr family transcriptional regulator [Nitrospira sp. M1]